LSRIGAHEETLEELSGRGDSTPVSLSYVSTIVDTRKETDRLRLKPMQTTRLEFAR